MPVLDNARHERYAQEIAKGEPACSAYVNAGFKANDGNAIRLKGNERIRERVEEILEASAERAEITREMVLRELSYIGFSDIRKLFQSGGSLKHVEDLDDATAASVSAIEVVTRGSPDGDAVESVAKIKMWDKRAALVDIAKMQGWIVEKHEHTGKDGGPLQIEDMSVNEKARRIAFMLSAGLRAMNTENSGE